MEKPTPYSQLKVFAHTEKIKSLLENKVTAPVYVRIKPTNFCNQKCFYCSYSDIDEATNKEAVFTDFIEWEILEKSLDSLAKLGTKAITFSGGGDPLCYGNIEQAFKKVLENKMDLSIITNGVLMTESKIEYLKSAKWVRISLDAGTKETYSKIRSVDQKSFDKIIENIKILRRQTNDCEIGINYVIHEMNYDEIYTLAEIAKSIGCNHVKYAARILNEGFEDYHGKMKQSVMQSIEKAKSDFESSSFRIISKYEDDFENDKTNIRSYETCYVKEFTCVIAADSKVYFCHDTAYKENFAIGSLKDQTFEDIWFSDGKIKRYTDFNCKNECVGHCVYDERNLLLNSLLSLDKNHINFI